MYLNYSILYTTKYILEFMLYNNFFLIFFIIIIMVSIIISLFLKYDIYDIIVHDEILQSIFGAILYIFSNGVIVC